MRSAATFPKGSAMVPIQERPVGVGCSIQTLTPVHYIGYRFTETARDLAVARSLVVKVTLSRLVDSGDIQTPDVSHSPGVL